MSKKAHQRAGWKACRDAGKEASEKGTENALRWSTRSRPHALLSTRLSLSPFSLSAHPTTTYLADGRQRRRPLHLDRHLCGWVRVCGVWGGQGVCWRGGAALVVGIKPQGPSTHTPASPSTHKAFPTHHPQAAPPHPTAPHLLPGGPQARAVHLAQRGGGHRLRRDLAVHLRQWRYGSGTAAIR